MTKILSVKKLKKLQKIRVKGFWAGYRGEVGEGAYRQGGKKAAYYRQGKAEGRNFRLKASRNG